MADSKILNRTYINLIGNTTFLNYLKNNGKIPRDNLIINYIIEKYWKKPSNQNILKIPEFTKLKELKDHKGNNIYGHNNLIKVISDDYVLRYTKDCSKFVNEEEINFDHIDYKQELIGYFIQWVLNQTTCKNINKIYEFGFFYEIYLNPNPKNNINPNCRYIYSVLEKFDMDLGEFFTQNKHEENKEFKLDKSLKDIATSLNYMHSLNFYHRDIKLDNIGIKNNDVLICDFGHSIYIKSGIEIIKGPYGTPLYTDPYLYTTNQYSIKGDEYSFGMMMHIILDYVNKDSKLIKFLKSIKNFIYENNDLITPYKMDDLKNICDCNDKDSNQNKEHNSLIECFHNIINNNKITDNNKYIAKIKERKFPDKLLDNNQKQPLVNNTSSPIYTQLEQPVPPTESPQEKVVLPLTVPNKEVPSTEVVPNKEVQPTKVAPTKVVPKRKVVNRDLKGGKKTNKKRRTKKI